MKRKNPTPEEIDAVLAEAVAEKQKHAQARIDRVVAETLTRIGEGKFRVSDSGLIYVKFWLWGVGNCDHHGVRSTFSDRGFVLDYFDETFGFVEVRLYRREKAKNDDVPPPPENASHYMTNGQTPPPPPPAPEAPGYFGSPFEEEFRNFSREVKERRKRNQL